MSTGKVEAEKNPRLVISAIPRRLATRESSARVVKNRSGVRKVGTIDTAVMNAPQFCTQTTPTGSTYWCDDPISKRRGLALGRVVAGVYYDTGFGNTGGDVDAQPLPQFPGLNLTATGTLKWNESTLQDCPPPQGESLAAQELIELLEAAANEGILIE